jgi:hypothetical protein
MIFAISEVRNGKHVSFLKDFCNGFLSREGLLLMMMISTIVFTGFLVGFDHEVVSKAS